MLSMPSPLTVVALHLVVALTLASTDRGHAAPSSSPAAGGNYLHQQHQSPDVAPSQSQHRTVPAAALFTEGGSFVRPPPQQQASLYYRGGQPVEEEASVPAWAALIDAGYNGLPMVSTEAELEQAAQTYYQQQQQQRAAAAAAILAAEAAEQVEKRERLAARVLEAIQRKKEEAEVEAAENAEQERIYQEELAQAATRGSGDDDYYILAEQEQQQQQQQKKPVEGASAGKSKEEKSAGKQKAKQPQKQPEKSGRASAEEQKKKLQRQQKPKQQSVEQHEEPQQQQRNDEEPLLVDTAEGAYIQQLLAEEQAEAGFDQLGKGLSALAQQKALEQEERAEADAEEAEQKATEVRLAVIEEQLKKQQQQKLAQKEQALPVVEPKSPPKMPAKKGQYEFVEFVEPRPSGKLRGIEWMEKRVPADEEYRRGSGLDMFMSAGNLLFLAAVAMGCVMAATVTAGGFYYYKHIRAARDDPFDEFMRYSPTGPGRDKLKRAHLPPSRQSPTGGDDSLAYKAQLQHYRQTKQRIIGGPAGLPPDHIQPPCSDDEDDDDLDQHNFSVYECPGLAPTGDIVVQNPNFVGGGGGSTGSVKSPSPAPSHGSGRD